MLNVVKHLIADMQFRYAKFANRSFPPSAKQLRAKAGRTMVALSVARGIGNFAEAQGKSERSGAKDSSPWFCPVCRAKARCGKEAFLPT
jgi:hypothetical protein